MDRESLPAWRRYLRFWGANVTQDVTEEIALHLEELYRENLQRGMAEADARRAALQRFGDPDRIASQMRALAEQRETTMKRQELLSGIGRDVRFAMRQLASRPAFVAIALVTLALGIGANTAIFSAVNGVLIRPLPVDDLDRIVFVHDNIRPINLMETALDPSEVLALDERGDVLEASGAVRAGSANLTGNGEARRLARGQTMGRFFDVFGVAPHIGRIYRPDESENGQHRVALLSYDLWRELGADSAIIARRLTLNGERYEVVGVMRPDFRFPRGTQLWTPFPITPESKINRGRLMMQTVAKLRPGVTQEQFRSRLDAMAVETRPGVELADFWMSSRPFVEEFAGQLRPTLLVLLAAVGFVLLIACANVASLQLVHGAARQREYAVRAALGASRWSLVRQLLVENLLISAGGGVLGLLVGVGMLALLRAAGAAELPALQDVRIDRVVLAFAAIATIASGLLFGLVPALRGGRVDLHEGLKEGARNSLGSRRSRLLQAGVVIQVALTVVLLAGSALMIRSLRELLAQNPGFDPQQVHTMRMTVSRPGMTTRQLTQFYDELLQRLQTVSAFDGVGMVSELPFSGSNDSSPFRIIGREENPDGPALHANLHTVGGNYFSAMRIPLIRGRTFDASDVKDRVPLASVIDERLATLYFGDEDPVGKRINQGMDSEIIGVVGTVSQGALGEPPKATVYYPYRQHDWYSSMFLTVRSALPLATVQSIVRSELRALDPTVPLYEARTLDERIGASLAPQRLTMIVLTGLSALSLLLAVFGLYGVISYAVSQRTTEFGIRMALGAQAANVRVLVVRQGVLLALAGVIVGVLGALVATRGLSALVFGVSPRDPLSLGVVAVALVAVTALASYVPARRATRVSPVDALRSS